MWVYVFDGNFGVFNDIVVRLGLIDRFVSWMGDPAASFSIVAAAMTWTGMPLMAIILLAALQTIPGDLYEAASLHGATAWDKFRQVTLPHLLPTILFLLLSRPYWFLNQPALILLITLTATLRR